MKLLRREEVVAGGGLAIVNVQARTNCDEYLIRDSVYELHRKGLLVSIPDNEANRWYRKYYLPPSNKGRDCKTDNQPVLEERAALLERRESSRKAGE